LALDPPLELLVLLGTLGPLAYYARLLFVGLSRAEASPGRATISSIRPAVTPLDLTELRGWLGRTWSDNRLASAVVGTVLLALLALAVSAGGFDLRGAAAGLPPTIEGVQESFDPTGPEGPLESTPPDVPAQSNGPAPSS
jgi:hypothetical protein